MDFIDEVHKLDCRGGLDDLAKMSQMIAECPDALEKKIRCRQLGCPCPPLLAAVRAGHHECITFLLDIGASPNAYTRGAETALQIAIVNRRVDLVTLLLERGASCCSSYSNFLNLASMTGHLQIMKLLLDYGADPNLADLSALTPAQTAIRHNQDDALKLLLLYGTSIDSPNLLHYLIQSCRFQRKRWDKKIRMVNLLWSFGADLHKKNEVDLSIFDILKDLLFPRLASDALLPIINELSTKPMSLQALCRLNVRKFFVDTEYLTGIKTLQPLPPQVNLLLHYASE